MKKKKVDLAQFLFIVYPSGKYVMQEDFFYTWK